MFVGLRIVLQVVAPLIAVAAMAQVGSVPLSIPDTTSAVNSPTPLSQRVVAYDMDAKYNAKAHSLDATETLTYHNLTGQALDTFPFHLYLNAFQPQSTWIHEAHRDGNFRSSNLSHWKPEDYGSNTVTSFEVEGMGDLTSQMQFVSPDDANPND